MNKTDIPIELKPCPFCGHHLIFDQAHEIWWHGAGAPSCIGMAIQLEAGDEEAWNTRATDPALKECVEALEGLVERLEGVPTYVELCGWDDAVSKARATLARLRP